MHKKNISHEENVSSMQDAGISHILSDTAKSSALVSLSYAIIVHSGFACFNAFATEPPINPRPIKPNTYFSIVTFHSAVSTAAFY